VNAIAVSGDTVYLAGRFTTVANNARQRLAAVSAGNGALRPWAPTADQEILALAVPVGKGSVIAAGRLELLNGVPTLGMGAIDSSTGANRPWAINQLVKNYGPNAAIWSLATDGDQVYGSAYDYFGPSEFEGSFAASADDGSLVWLNTCKGDTYDVAPLGEILYSVGHPHNCAPIGGHPQTEPWTFEKALATTKAADGVNIGGDFPGQPAPRLLHWSPNLANGTFTGQSQAAWTVAGNDQYVVLGGEFPTVNFRPQQGLVRFAVRSIAPNLDGPQGYAETKPSLV
jgi:hypothetical protein